MGIKRVDGIAAKMAKAAASEVEGGSESGSMW